MQNLSDEVWWLSFRMEKKMIYFSCSIDFWWMQILCVSQSIWYDHYDGLSKSTFEKQFKTFSNCMIQFRMKLIYHNLINLKKLQIEALHGLNIFELILLFFSSTQIFLFWRPLCLRHIFRFYFYFGYEKNNSSTRLYYMRKVAS